MDSFFEEPRPIPKPTPVVQEIQAFHVPEVSLMFQNSKTKCNSNVKLGKPVQSYNAWKLRTSPIHNTGYDSFLFSGIHNKENHNVNEQYINISKKQVRFESPKHDEVPHDPLVFHKVSPNADVFPSQTLQNVENTKHDLFIDNSPKSHFSKQRIDSNNVFIDNSPKSHFSKQHIDSNNIVPHYPYEFHKVMPTSNVSHKLQNHKMVNDESSSFARNTRPLNIEYPCKTMANLQTFQNTNDDDIPKSHLSKIRMPPNTLIRDHSKQNISTNATANVPNSLGKMYTSHLPNRELDLSFLEVANKPCYTTKHSVTSLNIDRTPIKHSHTPYMDSPKPNADSLRQHFDNPHNIRHHFANIDSQGHNTDMLLTNSHNSNTENPSLPQIEPINTNETMNSIKQIDMSENIEIQPESVDLIKNTSENATPGPKTPSVSDLLTIIKLQNNQLLHLEKQVAKLIQLSEKSNNHNVETESQTTKTKKNVVLYKDQQVGTSFISDTENSSQKKMSVGMMTSFEVSFKKAPPTNKRNQMKHLSPVQDVSFVAKSRAKKRDFKKAEYRNSEPNIPILKNWKKTNETEYSLGSHESLDIQEPPESPENSIHIDMQEYESDSDDECSSYDDGWTFYKDILGQVNNILDNSASIDCKPSNRHRNQSKPCTDTTMNKIKYAAMQRLENHGYLNSKKDPFRPNEISFAVKQLLMKYMDDEELADAVHTHDKYHNKETRRPKVQPVQTIKYLQQCNVVTQNPQYNGGKGKTLKKQNRRPSSNNEPKILDITTLKQQPKLL